MVTRIGPKKPPRNFVKKWMEKRELNQTDVANRLEVGSGTISKVLAKPEAMNAKWLAAFADVLEIEVPDLFRDPDRPTQEDLLKGLSDAQRSMLFDMVAVVKKRA